MWWLCGLSVVFWLTAQQSGSSLVVFAESNTERIIVAFGRAVQIGPGHFGALHGLQVLMLLPLLMAGMAWLHRRRTEPSTLAKMAWGYVVTAAAFVVARRRWHFMAVTPVGSVHSGWAVHTCCCRRQNCCCHRWACR